MMNTLNESKRYCIWNNKGGVGKTFLTYCLAIEYAQNNPHEVIAVLDMCPQANISEMLLGGNGIGERNLEKLSESGLTIAGYIQERYERGRLGNIGTEAGLFLSVKEYNQILPGNLFLLPGDTNLDICSKIIDYFALAPDRKAWKNSRELLVGLMNAFSILHKQKKVVFFADCNPSFSNYTELAILASNKLIIPCTGDSASIRGISNLFRVVYGISPNGKKTQQDDIFQKFHHQARDNGMILPKISHCVLNKSRTHKKEVTAAYRAHVGKIGKLMEDMLKASPDIFDLTRGEDLVFNVKDSNNLALIMNYTGCPISQLQPKQYTIFGQKTQANITQIKSFQENIQEVAKML